MDFLFFYELKNREIETLTLIKCELERRGHSCAISHFSAWGYGRNMLKNPKVVIVPWLRGDDNVYTFTRNIWRTKKIVNLQCEQVYSAKDVELNNSTCRGLARKAYHLCWGEESQKRLLSCGIPEDHLPITGCIKMDYFSPYFSPLFKSKSEIANENLLDFNKKWILFISSFAFATYNQADLEYLYKTMGNFSEFVQTHKKSRAELLLWIDELLSKDESIEFLYKLHPSENIDNTICEYEKRHTGFHIITNDSLQQWLHVADAIDVWYSTSIAEIYYSGKTCNVLRPFLIPDTYELPFFTNGRFVETIDEFVKVHTTPIDQEFPVDLKVIMSNYNQTDVPSYIRTANVLEKVLRDPSSVADFYTGIIKQNHNTIRQYLKSLLGDIILKFDLHLSRYFSEKSTMFEILYYIEERVDGIEKLITSSTEKMGKIVKAISEREA